MVYSSPVCFDCVLQLECSEPLMIKHFTNFASVETEMCVAEMGEGYDTHEDDKPRVVTLALSFKGIIT